MENKQSAIELVKSILRSPLFHSHPLEQKLQTINAIIATGEISQQDVYRLLQEELQNQQNIQAQRPIQQRITGKIRIGQTARATSYPNFPGFEIIPAWSKGRSPWKNLSPFYLGPVNFIGYNGSDSAPIFENFWQSFKCWSNVTKQKTKDWVWPAEVHIDPQTGNPNEYWFRWHEALLHHNLPVRRPNGKAIPAYAFWYDAESKQFYKLDTINARKIIYIPYLKILYRQNPTYLQLLTKIRNGTNIMLVEPDGPLRDAYPQGKEFD